jgi:hypothetical protein
MSFSTKMPSHAFEIFICFYPLPSTTDMLNQHQIYRISKIVILHCFRLNHGSSSYSDYYIPLLHATDLTLAATCCVCSSTHHGSLLYSPQILFLQRLLYHSTRHGSCSYCDSYIILSHATDLTLAATCCVCSSTHHGSLLYSPQILFLQQLLHHSTRHGSFSYRDFYILSLHATDFVLTVTILSFFYVPRILVLQ